MTETATIRRADQGDIPGLVPLIHHVLRVSNTPDYGVENVERVVSHFTNDGIAAMMARCYTIVAELDGALVGTASLGTSAMLDTVAVRTFFVRPDIQRRGVGTGLLQDIEAEARRIGLSSLPVRSSIAGEPFYARHGFAKAQDHWEGDERTIEMIKPLT